jgi:disulfide bond formation protein DsbB
MVFVGFADLRISPSHIVVVRPVIGISDGMVIPSVGLGIYHAISGGRPYKIPVEWLVDINPVIRIDVPEVVIVVPEPVVVDTHAPQAIQPSAPVGHMNVPDSADPSVIIVKDREVRDLDYRPEIVILHIRVVVETGIEGYGPLSCHTAGLKTDLSVQVKVELSIGVY